MNIYNITNFIIITYLHKIPFIDIYCISVFVKIKKDTKIFRVRYLIPITFLLLNIFFGILTNLLYISNTIKIPSINTYIID